MGDYNDVWFQRVKERLSEHLRGATLTLAQARQLAELIVECTDKGHEPTCTCRECERTRYQQAMMCDVNMAFERAMVKPPPEFFEIFRQLANDPTAKTTTFEVTNESSGPAKRVHRQLSSTSGSNVEQK